MTSDILVKQCRRCFEVLPLDKFYKFAKSLDGLQRWCKECSAANNRQRYRSLSPQQRRHEMRSVGLKWRHGISLEIYESMVAAQEGKCAICKRTPSETNQRDKVLHVDHAHDTNKVRGLLCAFCNTSLGMLQENTLWMTRMVEYVEFHKRER